MNPVKPDFELTRVSDDGASEAPEIVALTDEPWKARADRRGFLGTGLTAALALGAVARSDVARATPRTGAPAGDCLFANSEPILSLAVSPAGDLLVSGGGGDQGVVKLWGLPEGNVIRKLKKGKSQTLALAIAPDGKLLVTGGGGSTTAGVGALKLWSLPSGAFVKRLGGDAGNVFGLAISGDGKLLASVSSIDRAVRIWSLPSGKLVRTLSSGITYGLALSPSSELLAAGSSDGTIRLWRLPDGELLEKVKAHAGDVLALAISPDGKTLVSGGAEGRIKLWRVPSLALVKSLAGHSGRVRSLAISHGGKLLASAGFDRTVKLWRLPSGSLVRSMTGHTDKVFAVVFSRDGTFLVSAGYDRTTRLWDVKTGRMKRCLADLEANPSSKKGTTIKGKNAQGQVVTWTQPCGWPIPPGAVCTCNCVPGAVQPPCACVGHTSCSCVVVSHYWYPN